MRRRTRDCSPGASCLSGRPYTPHLCGGQFVGHRGADVQRLRIAAAGCTVPTPLAGHCPGGDHVGSTARNVSGPPRRPVPSVADPVLLAAGPSLGHYLLAHPAAVAADHGALGHGCVLGALHRCLVSTRGWAIAAMHPDTAWQMVMAFRIGYPTQHFLSPRRPAEELVSTRTDA